MIKINQFSLPQSYKSSEAHITDISQIPKNILDKVDLVVDIGELNNKPSIVLDIRGEVPKNLRR